MNFKKLGTIGSLIFLMACGSQKGDQGDSVRKNHDGSSNSALDSSGCDSSKTPLGGGKGTEQDPYLLCSVAHLEAMASRMSGEHYALTRDIDMANEKHDDLGMAVYGIFDGRGHTIRNFSVHRKMTQENAFLFGQVFSWNGIISEIKNLNMENVQISVEDNIGGAAGLVGTNSGIITNVHVTGSIRGKKSIGGIVTTNFGKIIDSSFSGTVQGDHEVGGISARSSDYFIKNCKVSGKIAGKSSVGGVSGYGNRKFQAIDNQVEAEVTGEEDFGLVVGKKEKEFGE